MNPPQSSLYGPALITEQKQRKKALSQLRNRNPDRSGQISWTVTFALAATLFAAAFVFGYLWINLPQKIDDSNERIADQRLRLQILTTILNNAAVPECNCSAVDEHEFPSAFDADAFRVFNADDESKKARLDVDTLMTGAQTLEVRDADGTVAYLSDIPTYPTVFADDEFALYNAGDPTKRVMFDLSGLDPNSLVELAIQPKGGFIAYLSDMSTPTPIFQDDVFAIQHAADQSREFQFDVGNSGLDIVIQMTVQNASGVIAYLSDLWENCDEYSDEVFAIHAAGDPTRVMKFDVGGVSPLTTIDMTVQNKSGVVAYVGDLEASNFATITESRMFPDMVEEGHSSFQTMGVRRVSITLCGGGGSGSALLFTNSGVKEYHGGGAGGGFRRIVINDLESQFTAFNITIGRGGINNSTSTSCTTDTRGESTLLVGIATAGGDDLQLVGYGGGCAVQVDENEVTTNGTGFYGGCGAGAGSVGTDEPGTNGDLGGVKGACGRLSTTSDPETQPGPYRYPWLGGAHGGATSLSANKTYCTMAGECLASTAIAGGFPGRGRAGGAGGLFGNGGDSEPEFPGGADALPNTCAGGGSPEATVEVSPDMFVGWSQGGSGRVVIEYWLSVN